jgi:hypothetical protein
MTLRTLVPSLAVLNPPTLSPQSAAASITMSDILAVRSELQTKFETDMKQFKKDINARLEKEIATAVKESVATALAGINETVNKLLTANNTIVYDNMKAEREIITEATATAVSNHVDLPVTQAVARALDNLTKRSNIPSSPFRKKRSNTTNEDAYMEVSETAK